MTSCFCVIGTVEKFDDPQIFEKTGEVYARILVRSNNKGRDIIPMTVYGGLLCERVADFFHAATLCIIGGNLGSWEKTGTDGTKWHTPKLTLISIAPGLTPNPFIKSESDPNDLDMPI